MKHRFSGVGQGTPDSSLLSAKKFGQLSGEKKIQKKIAFILPNNEESDQGTQFPQYTALLSPEPICSPLTHRSCSSPELSSKEERWRGGFVDTLRFDDALLRRVLSGPFFLLLLR